MRPPLLDHRTARWGDGAVKTAGETGLQEGDDWRLKTVRGLPASGERTGSQRRHTWHERCEMRTTPNMLSVNRTARRRAHARSYQ
jgi:hypothetical protein